MLIQKKKKTIMTYKQPYSEQLTEKKGRKGKIIEVKNIQNVEMRKIYVERYSLYSYLFKKFRSNQCAPK